MSESSAPNPGHSSPTASPREADRTIAERYTKLSLLMTCLGIGAGADSCIWRYRGQDLPNVASASIAAFLIGGVVARLAVGSADRSQVGRLSRRARLVFRVNLLCLVAAIVAAIVMADAGLDAGRAGLTERIDDATRRRVTQAIETGSQQDLLNLLGSKDPLERLAAIQTLGQRRGRLAFAELSPHLIDAMHDENPEIVSAALDAAARFGTEAYPMLDPLLECCLAEDEQIGTRAVVAVLQVAPHHLCELDARVVPRLIAATRPENNVLVCRNAAYCLAAIDRSPTDVVPALESMLRDNDETVRSAAAFSLLSLGRQSRTASRSLVLAASQQSPVTSDRAAGAIAAMELDDVPLIETMVEGFLASGREEPLMAYAIASQGPERIGETVLRSLEHSVGDPIRIDRPIIVGSYARQSVDSRRLATAATTNRTVVSRTMLRWQPVIERWGARAVPSVLTPLLPERTKAACELLALLGPDAAEAVPNLSVMLEREQDFERRSALLNTLAAIGPAAAPAEPAVRKVLESDSAALKPEAAWCLWRICRKRQSSKQLVDLLLRQLEENDAARRTRAISRLRALGPDAASAVPHLIGSIGNGSRASQKATLEILTAIGPKAKDAVPALSSRLQTADLDMQRRVALALKSMGPAAAPATENLTHLIAQRTPLVPVEAVWALASIGPPAIAAVPRLEELTHRPSAMHRLAAIAALKKIDPPRGEAVRVAFGVYAPMWNRLEWITDNHGVEHPCDGPEPELASDVIQQEMNQSSVSPTAIFELGPAASHAKDELRRLSSEGRTTCAEAATRALLCLRPLEEIETLDLIRGLRFLSLRRLAKAELQRRDLSGDLAEIELLFKSNDSAQLARVCAAFALWLASGSQEAVDCLIDHVHQPDAFVSQAAVEFLQTVGPAAAPATGDLLARLNAPGEVNDPLVPLEALETLAAIGPPASDALPTIRSMIRDQEELLRPQAIRAFSRIADSADVVSTLQPLCVQGNAAICDQLFSTLAEQTGKQPSAIPLMVRLCQLEAKQRSRRRAEGSLAAIQRIRVFGELGPAAKAAEPYLLEEIEFGFVDAVRAEAIFALWQITASDLALPWLLELLDPNQQDDPVIYRLIGRMGESAQHAVPDLVRAISSGVGSDRWAAIEAVMRVGPAREAARFAIRRQRGSSDRRVSAAAALALWELGERQGVISSLSARLDSPVEPSPGSADRAYVAESLGRLGADALPAVARLEEVIYDPDREVAYAAAIALHKIAPEVASRHGVTDQYLATYQRPHMMHPLQAKAAANR